MVSELKYPSDDQIKVEWTKFHILIVGISTIFTLLGLGNLINLQIFSIQKVFSIIGLYIDIIGVLMASMKTPHFGAFMDGGELDKKKSDVERKWFVRGMYTVSIGMILQVIGTSF